jgi:hypothetical protein
MVNTLSDEIGRDRLEEKYSRSVRSCFSQLKGLGHGGEGWPNAGTGNDENCVCTLLSSYNTNAQQKLFFEGGDVYEDRRRVGERMVWRKSDEGETLRKGPAVMPISTRTSRARSFTAM